MTLETPETIQALRKQIAPFARPDPRRGWWQLGNTLVPYLACWAGLITLVKNGFSLAWVVPLVGVAALLLVRIFILLHDCAHGCFFASSRANAVLGYLCGILTFTPFHHWRRNHLVHHNTFADLDRRGVGDILTLTVEEYRAASRMKRLGYRLYRNPLILLSVGQAYFFLVAHRFPPSGGGRWERLSVALTNLGLAGILLGATYTLGLGTYLLLQLPIMLLAGALGLWLFYVQHQFEGVYWARHEVFDPLRAALRGSSYYRLPKVLQWFTGNIGLHHVHHLLPRIPNYRLQACCDASPALRDTTPLTLFGSLRSRRLKLWDEERQELVRFKAVKKR